MKWYIIFPVVMTACVAGCSKHIDTIISPEHYIGQMKTGLIDYNRSIITFDSGNQQPNFHTPTTLQGPNIPKIGTILDKQFFSDTLPQVVITNDRLIYSGIFSITFPESLLEWEYTTGGIEMLSFSNPNKQLYFSIVAGNPSISTERSDDKIKCIDTPIGTATATPRQVGDSVVYITTIMYPENTTPIQELCFVNNGLLYKISLTNYSKEYTDRILNSFRFIEHFEQQETAENTTPIRYQSPGPNPLYSIYPAVTLSGHTLMYSGLFHITLPLYLQFWKSTYPGAHGVDLYFTDKLFPIFQLDDIRYVHLVAQPIAHISSENNQDRCLAIQHDDSPSTIQTIITGEHNIVVYKKNHSYDSFGYQWKQGDLCFVDGSFVYTISIRQYSVSEVTSIIDSLIFIK